MGYEVDIRPARPWNPREPSYLDAYKRRLYKSLYVKPKVDPPNHDPRGYLETFETHEAPFRPYKKYVNPEIGYEGTFKLGKGPGKLELASRAAHLGTQARVITSSGEWWRRGKRYFVPTSGSLSEAAFKSSIRYIETPSSQDFVWRPCVRSVQQTNYFNPRNERRHYIPEYYSFEDKYARLTPSEFYSQVYTPRKIEDITKYKPEWFGSGLPYTARPFKKRVTMYLRRHPPLPLFEPEPPKDIPLHREFADYLVKHPQLQLFSADFRPELDRTHPSYVSKTRYDPLGRYDHFEDHGLTMQPDSRQPESPGSPKIPPHCPRMIHNQYLIVQ